MFTGPVVGTRSSRQIVGLYTVTEEDIVACRRFPDEIAYSAFPIDIHSPGGKSTRNEMTEFPYCGCCGISYRTMITKEIRNLVVAGRCFSATFEAQSAVRTTAIMGAMGHAAGVAAALALQKTEGDTRKVDPDVLRRELLAQGAYLA